MKQKPNACILKRIQTHTTCIHNMYGYQKKKKEKRITLCNVQPHRQNEKKMFHLVLLFFFLLFFMLKLRNTSSGKHKLRLNSRIPSHCMQHFKIK